MSQPEDIFLKQLEVKLEYPVECADDILNHSGQDMKNVNCDLINIKEEFTHLELENKVEAKYEDIYGFPNRWNILEDNKEGDFIIKTDEGTFEMSKIKSRSDEFDLKTYYSVENTWVPSNYNICVENNNRDCNCPDESEDSKISKLKVARKRRVILPKHIIILNDGDGIKYKCIVCNSSFGSRTNTLYHRYCDNVKKKPYKCDTCGRQFSKRTHLSYHLLEHTGELPFACIYCHKAFKTKAKMLRHREIHTDKTEKYSCHICERKFIFKSYFQIHLKRHSRKNSYECAVCQKTFSDKKSIRYHVSAHLGIKEFTCKYCEKSFLSKGNLNVHLITHERSLSYVCKECNKQFSQKRYLQKHALIHKESNSFICTLCEKIFTRKDNLHRHIFNSHLECEEVNVVSEQQNVDGGKSSVEKDIALCKADKPTNSLKKPKKRNSEEEDFCGTIVSKEQIRQSNSTRATSVIKLIPEIHGIIDFDCAQITKKKPAGRATVIRTTAAAGAAYRSKIYLRCNNSDAVCFPAAAAALRKHNVLRPILPSSEQQPQQIQEQQQPVVPLSSPSYSPFSSFVNSGDYDALSPKPTDENDLIMSIKDGIMSIKDEIMSIKDEIMKTLLFNDTTRPPPPVITDNYNQQLLSHYCDDVIIKPE